MALGKPVVGTKIGGTIEQIDNDITGLLVEPGDPADLAAALESLIKDPVLRARLGCNGKTKFYSSFEFEAFYKNIRGLQSSLVAKHEHFH